jgi:hypothetical protein
MPPLHVLERPLPPVPQSLYGQKGFIEGVAILVKDRYSFKDERDETGQRNIIAGFLHIDAIYRNMLSTAERMPADDSKRAFLVRLPLSLCISSCSELAIKLNYFRRVMKRKLAELQLHFPHTRGLCLSPNLPYVGRMHRVCAPSRAVQRR